MKLFRTRLRSRHPSHQELRNLLPLLPFRSVLRLGSTTEIVDPRYIQINSVEGVKNSSNKHLMKECFNKGNIKTAKWFYFDKGIIIDAETKQEIATKELPFPIVIKHVLGSRGTGNYLCDNLEEFNITIQGKNNSNYILEKYYSYTREYRLHVTKNGCFYTCRKMLKRDAPEKNKWQRHDDNCVWILENNEEFNKPVNWDSIVKDCVDALQHLGLDIAAFDVRVQSAQDKKNRKRENPEWIVIESASAPSMGVITLQKYIEEVPKIAKLKFLEKN